MVQDLPEVKPCWMQLIICGHVFCPAHSVQEPWRLLRGEKLGDIYLRTVFLLFVDRDDIRSFPVVRERTTAESQVKQLS